MRLSTFHVNSRIQTTFADPPKRDKPRHWEETGECLVESGPGKLLPFGVRKNPKIRPQIHMVGALKSAHSDKGHHMSSKKGNTYFDFYFLLRPIHLAFYISVKPGLLKYNAGQVFLK